MIVQLEWSILYLEKKLIKISLFFCIKCLLPKQGIYNFLVLLYIKNAGGECQPSNQHFGGVDFDTT